MENGLDLDITNYTMKDLLTFFKLASDKTYSISEIELRETEIREILLSSGHVDKRFKRDLLVFLETAKDWIITVKCGSEKQNQAPKSFQNVPQMDPFPNHPASKEAMPRTEELTTREVTPYVNTFNSEYYPGLMNPLKTRIINKCLNIDTRFRENFATNTSSDFMLPLPQRFTKVVSMQLTSIEFPFTFYGISSKYGNNYLYLCITQDVVGVPTETCYNFIIPDGNYSTSEFIDTLNNLLHSHETDGFSHIQFRIDSITGKTILEPTSSTTDILNIKMDFSLDANGNPDKTNIMSKIGWNLGFQKKKYVNSTTYVSETVAEPMAIRYIYLAIDDFNNSVNNHFVSAFQRSMLNTHILARIQVRGPFFSLMKETELNMVTEPRKYFGPVDLQKLHIQVYDDQGRILDMNNANFSCCLLFKMIYDL